MSRRTLGAVAGAAAVALVGSGFAASASVAAPIDRAEVPTAAASPTRTPEGRLVEQTLGNDNDMRFKPRRERTFAMREAARQIATGQAKFVGTGEKRAVRLDNLPGGTQFVTYPTQTNAKIFSVLVQFSNTPAPWIANQPADQRDVPGPKFNEIKQPDRTTDNFTYWEPNFDRNYFVNLFNGTSNSFRDFYLKESNGRYSATAAVSYPVTAKYNEASYGGDGIENIDANREYIKDTIAAWVQERKNAGQTDAQIAATVKSLDQEDRYDYDHDGNFKEPDGYIDHFSVIHAGEGQEAFGRDPGTPQNYMIWSHSSYANWQGQGTEGPANFKNGGLQIGNTGVYVGDYVTQPENGGLGVHAHEYGHDLGLPDFYDTTNRVSNGTGYWTLMSSGSWLSKGVNGPGAGTSPGYVGAYDRFQLGWNDIKTLTRGQDAYQLLSPSQQATTSQSAQTIAVPLKPYNKQTDLGNPASGSYFYYSGAANNMDSYMSAYADLRGAVGKTVGMNYAMKMDLEEGYDFTFVEVYVVGGSGQWEKVPVRKADGKPYVNAEGTPVDGYTGQTLNTSGQLAWANDKVDLTKYAGKQVYIRFRTVTDGGVSQTGFRLDNIMVTFNGSVVGTHTAESRTMSPWQVGGIGPKYSVTSGIVNKLVDQYYLVENRWPGTYDANLLSGPYSFTLKDNLVEYFPYAMGMLVWYIDGGYDDNNVYNHPGHGMALPVDAHPAPLTWSDGVTAGAKYQAQDAAFKTAGEKFPGTVLHQFGVPAADGTTHDRTLSLRGGTAVPGIDDTFVDSSPTAYYDASTAVTKYATSYTAGSGVKISTTRADESPAFMWVKIDYPTGY